MIFAPINSIPVKIPGKLHLLIHLLGERKSEFEAFASRTDNCSIRRTVWRLALECNQYAEELCSQLVCMGMQVSESPAGPVFSNGGIIPAADADIIRSCELSEKKLIHVYSSIVSDPLLPDNLKQLLKTQMQGLECAFLQTRLLENTLFHG